MKQQLLGFGWPLPRVGACADLAGGPPEPSRAAAGVGVHALPPILAGGVAENGMRGGGSQQGVWVGQV